MHLNEITDGNQPWTVPVRVGLAAKAHRTTGHAAEMAFFAVLTLVPSTIAVGALLGASRPLLGAHVVEKAEKATGNAVHVLMGPELANSVIAPFVHAQLTQANGGVAIGGLLIAWYLSGRLFGAPGPPPAPCYGVAAARPTLVERLLALAFALVSVVLVTGTAEMMVAG